MDSSAPGTCSYNFVSANYEHVLHTNLTSASESMCVCVCVGGGYTSEI